MTQTFCAECERPLTKFPCLLKTNNFCSQKCYHKHASKHRRIPLEIRFWEKVDRRGRNECWNWVGGKMRFGYGKIGLGGRLGGFRAAHIVSMMLHTLKPIPTGMNVLHSCDNPSCVNPAHLRIGTRKDNMEDAKTRNRLARGESHGNSKIDEATVRQIRKSTEPNSELAKKLGLKRKHVWKIRRKDLWTHV